MQHRTKVLGWRMTQKWQTPSKLFETTRCQRWVQKPADLRQQQQSLHMRLRLIWGSTTAKGSILPSGSCADSINLPRTTSMMFYALFGWYNFLALSKFSRKQSFFPSPWGLWRKLIARSTMTLINPRSYAVAGTVQTSWVQVTDRAWMHYNFSLPPVNTCSKSLPISLCPCLAPFLLERRKTQSWPHRATYAEISGQWSCWLIILPHCRHIFPAPGRA